MNSTITTIIISHKENLQKKDHPTFMMESGYGSLGAVVCGLLGKLWQKLSKLQAECARAWKKQHLNQVKWVEWAKCARLDRMEKADDCMAKADASEQLLFLPMPSAQLLSAPKISQKMINRTFRKKPKGDLYLFLNLAKIDKKKPKEPMIASRHRHITVYLSKYTQADCITASISKPSPLLFNRGGVDDTKAKLSYTKRSLWVLSRDGRKKIPSVGTRAVSCA